MLNALKYTEELEKAGFSREQADASVKVLMEVMNDSFATKSDLKEIGFKLESNIKELELKLDRFATKSDLKDLEFKLETSVSKLDSSIREMEYKLTIKLGTLLGTLTTLAVGVTATLVKLLASGH